MTTQAEYARQVEAMFTRAQRQIVEIATLFIIYCAEDVITTTPGPNLQYPEDTEYIATGRLRGAWDYGLSALGAATRWEGGPYTEHGDDTLAAIEAEVRSMPLQPLSYLRNDVAYGYLVHEGLGRHVIARPWVTMAAERQHAHANRARLAVMRGAE